MRVADLTETVGEIHKNCGGTGMDQGARNPPEVGDALHHVSVSVNIPAVAIVIQLFKM